MKVHTLWFSMGHGTQNPSAQLISIHKTVEGAKRRAEAANQNLIWDEVNYGDLLVAKSHWPTGEAITYRISNQIVRD
jgi:hypothetical protein